MCAIYYLSFFFFFFFLWGGGGGVAVPWQYTVLGQLGFLFVCPEAPKGLTGSGFGLKCPRDGAMA